MRLNEPSGQPAWQGLLPSWPFPPHAPSRFQDQLWCASAAHKHSRLHSKRQSAVLVVREELEAKMQALQKEVIQQGGASGGSSPQRASRASGQALSTHPPSWPRPDQTSELARLTQQATLAESLQQQLAVKDLILDSLEDFIPAGHMDQASCCTQGRMPLLRTYTPLKQHTMMWPAFWCLSACMSAVQFCTGQPVSQGY